MEIISKTKEKIKIKISKVIKYTDDFLFFPGLILFIHASYRINSIFGEYILSVILVILGILISRTDIKERR